MFFREVLKSDVDRQSFNQACARLLRLLQDCNRCLVTAWGMAQEVAAPTRGDPHPDSAARRARHRVAGRRCYPRVEKVEAILASRW